VIVGEVQLKKYGKFLEDYATQLREIHQIEKLQKLINN
jgi:hypothetical protein